MLIHYKDVGQAMVVGGINVEENVYWFFIISWTFRILAHEEDQYSYVGLYKILSRFSSIALKQPEAGPWRSGTTVLVIFKNICFIKYVDKTVY